MSREDDRKIQEEIRAILKGEKKEAAQPVGEVAEPERECFYHKDLRFEIVKKGGGEFILQIFSATKHNFHPLMDEDMTNAINKAFANRLSISRDGVDYKIEFVQMVNSYCVTVTGVHNIFWAELFKLLTIDIADNFVFTSFMGR